MERKTKRKIKEMFGGLAIGGGIISIIAFLIFYPIFIFWCGYFGVWILSQFVGSYIVEGFNLLFGRNVVTVELIPVLLGSLAVIGSYFKSTQTNNNK